MKIQFRNNEQLNLYNELNWMDDILISEMKWKELVFFVALNTIPPFIAKLYEEFVHNGWNEWELIYIIKCTTTEKAHYWVRAICVICVLCRSIYSYIYIHIWCIVCSIQKIKSSKVNCLLVKQYGQYKIDFLFSFSLSPSPLVKQWLPKIENIQLLYGTERRDGW